MATTGLATTGNAEPPVSSKEPSALPPGLLEKVLSSTAVAFDRQRVVRINDGAISRFVESGELSPEKYQRAAARVRLPLKFDNNAQEINFYGLLALLSFGGAHEPALLRLTDTTVEDSVKFGLIGSHLARERLDATWMKNAHVGSVSEGFKIPVREAAASSIPGVQVDKPGALVAHAKALVSALNSTGEALLSRGYSDLAQFVIHSAKSDPGAEGFVRSLAGALPAFQDTETLEGDEVVMLKNAQVLAGELCARMGPTVDALRFADADRLTAVADADVITALIAVGIMEPVVSNTAEGGVRQGGDAFKAEDTAALRATAVQACHRLAKAFGDEYQPHDLSFVLKRLGRRKDYANVPRYVPRISQAL